MLVHTVVANLRDKADGRGKQENIAMIRDKINALRHEIPEVLSVDLLLDDQETPGNYDLVFITKHRNRAKLAEFLNHPAYVKLEQLGQRVLATKIVVDSTATF